MEEFCNPYSGKTSLSSYCFGVLGFSAADSIFFSSLILIELFLHKMKFCSRPSQAVLALIMLTIGWNFLGLTLTLFYLKVKQVALAEVLSSLLQTGAWLVVFNCYYKYYSPYEFCKTSLISLKFFVIFRAFCVVYLIAMGFLVVPEESEQKVVMWVKVCGNFWILGFLAVLMKKKKLEIDQFLLEEDSSLGEYEKAGVFSRLIMNWTFGLLKLGNTRPLETTDIDNVRKVDSADHQQEVLHEYINSVYNTSDKYSLLKTIIRCYKWELLTLTSIGVFSSFLEFSTPVFVALLENYLNSNDPLWKGVSILIYLLLTKVFHCLVANQYDFQDRILSLHVKSALSCEIYEKLLKISVNSISQNKEDSLSYGKIVNLIQVDVESITYGIISIMNLIILPFTWGFGFYLIFVTIGWQGGVTSTAIIIILMIFNLLLGRKMSSTRKELMEKKDVRMKACNELLSNIRIFKVYGWEEKLAERIYEARELELKKQLIMFVIQTLSIFISWGAQNYIATGVIVTLVLSGKTLTPTNVYAGLAIVRVVKNSLYIIPNIINSFIETKISLTRIQDYLRAKDQIVYIEKRYSGNAVDIKNSSFTWDIKQEKSDDGELQVTKRTLKDINLEVNKGELLVVVGKFASGKSSLLQSLIPNMVLMAGEDSSVSINGKVAYCNQESWIMNKTIRDNILFYKEMNEEKYSEVLRVCLLESDLDIFPGGDLTEIGERGINLSGGQKARISIARSVYADTDIYLFDDPLAALDQYVGKTLFEQCILKHLKGKTRILVTNNQQYLSHADRILVFNNGEIVQTGIFSELSQQTGFFSQEVMVDMKQAELEEGLETKKPSTTLNLKEKKLIDSEERAIGSVKLSVYLTYAMYAGGWTVIFLGVLFMVLWQVDRMYTDIYLADWTDQSAKEQDRKMVQNIVIYSVGSFFINIFILFRAGNNFLAGLRAARIMFKQMMEALLNASIPLFYDVNPMGRVLNRFSKDQNSVDSVVIGAFNWSLAQVFQAFMYITFCIYTVPVVILTVPITLYLARRVQNFYLESSRELTRLESISRSPIVQHFSETLNGLSTIRAFRYEENFKSQYYSLFNQNTALNFYKTGCSCWVSIMFEVISDIVLACSTLIIIFSRDSIDPGLAGACLTYAMMLPEGIYYSMSALSSLENSMVSVERVHNMKTIEKEEERKGFKDELLIQKSWPQQGQIEFMNFSARYRPNTDLILKNLTFIIKENEKIGVMGRTGSGKSSLVNALFRVIPADAGAILIDNIDIAEIGLNLLRQKLCVIPQDPALFRGKLRENIDPLLQFTDESILNTLKKVELDLGIEFEISDGASNLSVGQKQLICIARALLRGSKIVVLDEATASIDFKTDILIQEIIKVEFKMCTVLTIAHRINSILESDRILVLDNGMVAEFDTPEKLRNNNGVFCKLTSQY